MYKDKDKQKQANKVSAQRRRDKAKGMTQGMTIIDEQPNVIPDEAAVKAGARLSRLPDHDTLESWADGNGTPYQQRLGLLNRHYNVTKHGAPLSTL